jgi:hypothetical protein
LVLLPKLIAARKKFLYKKQKNLELIPKNRMDKIERKEV